MKKFVILIVCLLLSGCSKNSGQNCINDVDKLLNNLDFNYNARVNHSTDNFEYYLPSDAYEIDGNANAAAIEINEAKMVMNLNIKAILNSKYYSDYIYEDDGFFKDSVLIYENSGNFDCDDGHNTYYDIKIYDHERVYLIHLVCDNLIFYGSSNAQDLKETVRHMIIIAKSCIVNKDSLIVKYSAKDVIDFEKKQVDLFEYVIPNSGYLSEMVNHVNGQVQNEPVEIPEDEEEPQEDAEISEDEDLEEED